MGKPKSKWTVLLIPSRRERLRKWVFTPASVLAGALAAMLVALVANLFLWRLAGGEHKLARTSQETAGVLEELRKSNELARESMVAADRLVADLGRSVQERESEVADLQRRYDELAVLVSGQEELADLHRKILLQRSPRERAAELIVSFAIGVAATLFGSLLLLRRAKEVSLTPSQIDEILESQG